MLDEAMLSGEGERVLGKAGCNGQPHTPSPLSIYSRSSIRRGALIGSLACLPWFIAVIGWTSHWNAYFNLTLTLGGFVLWATFIVGTKPDDQDPYVLIASLNGQVYDWRRIAEARGYVEGEA